MKEEILVHSDFIAIVLPEVESTLGYSLTEWVERSPDHIFVDFLCQSPNVNQFFVLSHSQLPDLTCDPVQK